MVGHPRPRLPVRVTWVGGLPLGAGVFWRRAGAPFGDTPSDFRKKKKKKKVELFENGAPKPRDNGPPTSLL